MKVAVYCFVQLSDFGIKILIIQDAILATAEIVLMVSALRRSLSSPAIVSAHYSESAGSSDSQRATSLPLPPISLTKNNDDQTVPRITPYIGACVDKTWSGIMLFSGCTRGDTSASQLSWLDIRLANDFVLRMMPLQSWDEARTRWISVCQQQMNRIQNAQLHFVHSHTGMLSPILEGSGYWIISYSNSIECNRSAFYGGNTPSVDVTALMNMELLPILQRCLQVKTIDCPREAASQACPPNLPRKREHDEKPSIIQKRVRI